MYWLAPRVLNVMKNVWLPASAAVNVYFAGNTALASELLKLMVPW